ncbi:hypothetical protein [Granulicella sibirica]|uniref:hypothetical protein n=1 Tax=Granulicella sibirica TaxID=2479048 RepID=UPI0010087963|nr:hypothetical protein [Granulicella sibirica]
MSVIPCKQDHNLSILVDEYAESLKAHAHTLGNHGLSEEQFYGAGVFRGAIERIRGQFSAETTGKREFVRDILNHMQDGGFIAEWEPTAGDNRHEYVVKLPTGKTSVVEPKGCLDGNNTTIFERPPYADEFFIWSLCQNAAADPRLNVWSGLHTRLSSEMLIRKQCIDGVIVWDMVCGTVGRPCPKLFERPNRTTRVAHYTVPPTCLYVLPKKLPELPERIISAAQTLEEVELLRAFHLCFGGNDDEINYVDFDVAEDKGTLKRRTRVRRNGAVVKESNLTFIRRA